MAKRHPVMEIFGPTVQGEGPDAGRPAYFVRFGGCDFRCSWCDSMHAVEPALVRANAHKMEASEIMAAIEDLDRGPSLVVLSGGNPALHHLGELVERFHAVGMDVSVETQGTVWRPWLAHVDRLVISPKPPSSGMTTEDLPEFMRQARNANAPPALSSAGGEHMALKVVIADDEDLDFARQVHQAYEDVPLYLSVCTPYADGQPQPTHANDDYIKAMIGHRLRWLNEKVAADPLLSTAKVLPQLHVLAWGTVAGV